ncbi:MAG: DUF1343 domain-containing protein [Bacteroidota bacterium]
MHLNSYPKIKIFVLFFALWQQSCHNNQQATAEAPAVVKEGSIHQVTDKAETATTEIVVGAARTETYLPYLRGKKLGLVVNHTSMVDEMHLVDLLLANDLQIGAIFAPEHGFRGTADAGEKVQDGIDVQTGLPLISLYGSHKEPTAEDLAEIDALVFDIQDVGARFYTYISTMHYVMQAAAKKGIPIFILDRPNPNGHYVDGPVLKPSHQSFVGMHPVPVVHGMTVGEYARMINGQGWLDDGLKADLQVVSCVNYTHDTPYNLPIAPSPNLPNMRSIYLYPSLCFFEGTVFSVGRGTDTQFQIYGHPDFGIGSYQFTPQSSPGAKYPKLEGKSCKGISLVRQAPKKIRDEGQLNLFYLLQAYTHYSDQKHFFLENKFIDKLAGSTQLRVQIRAGLNQEEIRASWQEGLLAFKAMRRKYLLYD